MASISGSSPAAEARHLLRSNIIARLTALSGIDVVVVGGGINGAATFRDLSLQGVRCLIVDREDFGAGASGASTRLAHGGLRYLENGEIRLVAEATRERNRLLRNAPHAVTPLLVTVPSFSIWGGMLASFGKLVGLRSRISSRGLVLLKIGLLIYDFLGRRGRVMGTHSVGFGRTAKWTLPDLHPATRGIATYYDSRVTGTERIAFELVEDGLAANPECLALNHCVLEGLSAQGVMLRDTCGGRRMTVMPRLLVNAAGAWIDDVNRRIAPTAELVAGTKGSHLVIDNPALYRALSGRAFSFDDGRGRMCIAYPFDDMVLLGSTDLRVDDPNDAVCEAGEVAYLLGAIRLIFPMIEVLSQDIRYRFCGVRPLPRSSSRDAVDVSRDHSLAWREPDAVAPFPVMSLVGGKWTTFRAFAEQASDRVLARLGMSRRQDTAELAIGGGRDFPRDPATRQQWVTELARITGIAEARIDSLLGRYGTRARDVAMVCAAQPDRPLPDAPSYSEREILFLATREMAISLDDILYRRTSIALSGHLTFPLLAHLALLLGQAHQMPAEALLRAIIPRLAHENGVDFASEFGCWQLAQAA